MNQIQLELFPQEAIFVAFHHRADIIYFEFERQRAWAAPWGVASLQRIFQENGSPEFASILRINAFTGFPPQKFLCSIGTWEKLSLQADFRLGIPPWARELFDTEESI